MGHPYWSKAVQYQVTQQAKPQQKSQGKSQQPKQQGGEPRDNGGFDSLIVGQLCVIKLGTGEIIKGVVSAASKYFYLVSVDEQVIIINKAYVVTVAPIQNQNLGRGGDGNKQNSQGGGVDGQRSKWAGSL
jgi:hypothetical protein